MRIYWWQGGFHIKPESREETAFLLSCTESKSLEPLAKASTQFDLCFGVLRGEGFSFPNGEHDKSIVGIADYLDQLENGIGGEGGTNDPHRVEDGVSV